MTETLAAWSLVGVYSAAAVYLIAFVLYVVDLSGRAAAPVATREAVASGATREAVASGATREAVASAGGATLVAEKVDAPARSRSRWSRTALALTVVGWVVHVAATLMRGIAAERVPWANMFEFALTGTVIIVGVYLGAQLWRPLSYLGAYVTGLVVLLLTLATVNFYVDVVPLPPALQSGWLVFHVLVAILATGFFALGAGLSILQLVQQRRESGRMTGPRFLATLPASEGLERLASRLNVIGFVFWTFTLIAGAIWAERAWGRYWGWDTKEVWTFVIWVVFAGYIHARATHGWRGSRSAWLAIIGFGAVLFNFTVVNLFFTGLHSYSGL